MQVKTLLNRVCPVKGFVYQRPRMVERVGAPNGVGIDVELKPRRGSRGFCSGCAKRGRTYDTLRERRFGFVPLWGIAVTFIYAMRRIDCQRCGPTVEWVPWSKPANKRPITSPLKVPSSMDQEIAVCLGSWVV